MKLIALLMTAVVATSVGAQDLSYPELHVTPRASDRIKMEIPAEASYAWKSNMPIQLSALATIFAASKLSGNTKDDPDNDQSNVPGIAMAFGAAWIGATVWASLQYRPYRSAYGKIHKMPEGSMREKLTKERYAEEEINSLRSMSKKMKWLSVFTNLGLASMMMSANPNETDAEKQAYLMATLSGAMAFVPLFFDYRWEAVANEQEKYKKKIYAPVAYAPIVKDPFTFQNATGMSFAWTF